MQFHDPRKPWRDSLYSDDNRNRFRYRKDHRRKELFLKAFFYPGNLLRPLKLELSSVKPCNRLKTAPFVFSKSNIFLLGRGPLLFNIVKM